MSTTPPKHLLCRISSQVYNALGEIHRRRIQKWDNQWWQIKLVERLHRHFLSGFAFFEVFWLIFSCLTNIWTPSRWWKRQRDACCNRLPPICTVFCPLQKRDANFTEHWVVLFNNDCWVSISGSGSSASFFAKPKNRNGTATLENLETWNLLLGYKG